MSFQQQNRNGESGQQQQQQQNNSSNGSFGSQFYSGWLKTLHSWPKSKEQQQDPDAKCTICGLTYGKALEKLPCQSLEMQEAERQLADKQRKIDELLALLRAKSSDGDGTGLASVRRERDM